MRAMPAGAWSPSSPFAPDAKGAVGEGEPNREAMMRQVLFAVILAALALVGGWMLGLRLVGR
jgi:hypothetical protein